MSTVPTNSYWEEIRFLQIFESKRLDAFKRTHLDTIATLIWFRTLPPLSERNSRRMAWQMYSSPFTAHTPPDLLYSCGFAHFLDMSDETEVSPPAILRDETRNRFARMIE